MPDDVWFVFALPFATPSLNQYQRWHWTRRAKFRDECCLTIRFILKRNPGIIAAMLTGAGRARTRVIVTRHSSGCLDHDNLVGGCKPLFDAMVREGLLVDDSPQWVEQEYLQERDKKGHGRTVIRMKRC